MTSDFGLIFPGQGSQSVGMGRAFYETVSDVRQLYDEASDLLRYDVAALCFTGPADRLNLTEYTQPALLLTSIAAFRVVQRYDLTPLAVAGHSLGEYSAIVAAGGLDFSTALSLVEKRGRYMSEAAAPGSSLVVALLGASPELAEEACRDAACLGIVAPANFNCPGQIVIAGEKAAVERAIEVVKSKGVRKTIPLAVSVPVHTPLMKTAAERLGGDLERAVWSDLSVPLINNVDARPLTRAVDLRTSLIRQLASPVRWEQSMRAMHEMGVKTFIEVGPGTVLSGLAKRIVPAAKVFNIQDPASLDATLSALAIAQ